MGVYPELSEKSSLGLLGYAFGCERLALHTQPPVVIREQRCISAARARHRRHRRRSNIMAPAPPSPADTAIFKAALKGDLEALRQQMDRRDASTPEGYTALSLAVCRACDSHRLVAPHHNSLQPTLSHSAPRHRCPRATSSHRVCCWGTA